MVHVADTRDVARAALIERWDVERRAAPQPTAAFPPWQGMQYMRDQFSRRAKLSPLDNDRYSGVRWTTVREHLSRILHRSAELP